MPHREPIARKPLLTAMISGGKPIDHAEIMEINFAPGQKAGFHRHPCPVLGYVARGAITFQIDGEPARILKPGDAFFEPAETNIRCFDNASETEVATFIAFYLLGAGETELIEML